MIEFVVLRHAPTSWNREKRLQGRTDVALDEDGVATAQRWRPDPRWRDYLLLTSPLARARMTAAILFPDAKARIDDRLIEMDFGAWEGKRLSDLRETPGAEAKERERMGLDFRAPGGESPRDVQARLAPLLSSLARHGAPAIAVTHKAVIRALYSMASGWAMLDKPAHKLKDQTAQIFALNSVGELSIQEMNRPLTGEG